VARAPPVGAYLRATPWWKIGAGFLAGAASYACLATMEWCALGAIGRPLPRLRAGLAAFVAWSLSNTVGLTVATGTVVRLRLYSQWGLTSKQGAAITLLSTAAVTLSTVVSCGVGLLLALGPTIYLKAGGLLLVLPGLLWLARFGGSQRTVAGVRLTAPPFAGRARILAAGVGDSAFSGAALFLLLPGASPTDFPGFLAAFAFGSLASGAFGIPNGLGVLDAAVIGLGARASAAHETAAALILYRIVYNVVPSLVGLLVFGVLQFAPLKPRLLSGPRAPKRSRRPGT